MFDSGYATIAILVGLVFGMFSIGVYIGTTKLIEIIRDRLGKKNK